MKKTILTLLAIIAFYQFTNAQCSFDTNDAGSITSGNFTSTTSNFNVSFNIGSSWTACKDGNLDKISILSVSASTVTINIYSGGGNGGTLLGSATATSSAATSISERNLVFDFSSSNISLTNGSTYSWILSSGGFNTRLTNNNIYNGGAAYQNSTEFSTNDFMFKVEISAVISNTAPVIASTVANQNVNDIATISPFSSITTTDADGDNLTATITLDNNAKGILSGAGLSGSGPYTISSASAASIQSTLQSLTFNPTDNRAAVSETTTFTIVINDGTETDTDTTTTVISNAVAPTTSSIAVTGSPAKNATSVSFLVTFNESVTGVDTSDFSVDGSGVTGSISGISGSGTSRTITVTSVSGSGTLSIDLNASGTGITDTGGKAISGGFTSGATHSVDTDSPTLASSSPADNATDILLDQNIELTFSENISKGLGNITIFKSSDDSVFETINVTSGSVTIALTVATINPTADFELNTEYYIQIASSAFVDVASNSYAGTSNTTSLSFTTQANQTNSFVPSSGVWSTDANWSLGRAPIISDNIVVDITKTVTLNTTTTINNVTINAGGTLNILSGNAMTINGNLSQSGTFNILSDATTNGSLIVKGSATGSVTYQRYLSTNWHLVGAPVEGQSINGLSGEVETNGNNFAIAPYKNNTTSLLRWNYYTTNAGTNDIAASGNFLAAKGYTVKKKTAAGTLTFTGTINTEDEPISITDGGDNPSGNRWNLIANPYYCCIKW